MSGIYSTIECSFSRVSISPVRGVPVLNLRPLPIDDGMIIPGSAICDSRLVDGVLCSWGHPFGVLQAWFEIAILSRLYMLCMVSCKPASLVPICHTYMVD